MDKAEALPCPLGLFLLLAKCKTVALLNRWVIAPTTGLSRDRQPSSASAKSPARGSHLLIVYSRISLFMATAFPESVLKYVSSSRAWFSDVTAMKLMSSAGRNAFVEVTRAALCSFSRLPTSFVEPT